MQDKAAYHSAAVEYNTRARDHFEQQAADITQETVAKWCRSIANQHEYHRKRHQNALDRLNKKTASVALVTGDAPTELSEANLSDRELGDYLNAFDSNASGADEPAAVSEGDSTWDFLSEDGKDNVIVGEFKTSEDHVIMDPEQCPEKAWHVPGSGVYDSQGHEIALGRWEQINGTTEA